MRVAIVIYGFLALKMLKRNQFSFFIFFSTTCFCLLIFGFVDVAGVVFAGVVVADVVDLVNIIASVC